jgi:hypothetical protein
MSLAYILFFSFFLVNSLSINSSLLGHDRNLINIVYSFYFLLTNLLYHHKVQRYCIYLYLIPT